MDAEVEGEDELHPAKRLRVAERVPLHVPPEVEPQNRDFDVKKIFGQVQILLWRQFFGDSENSKRSSTPMISRNEIPVFELWR